jgi:general secretion pathway protein L
MVEKILGIDLGSDTVKLVQVTRQFRTMQLSGFANGRLPAGPDPAEQAKALKALIDEHDLGSDRYFVAVGTNRAFLRRLSFPFSTERKIGQVIRFELEPLLPLGIEEVEVDFIKTEGKENGGQSVLAAAIPKSFLEPLLSSLKQVDIEPEVVDLDGSVLNVIARELREQLPRRTVILDIGLHSTNLLYCVWGRRHYLRALAFGCAHLVKAVANVHGSSTEEAEKQLLALAQDGSTDNPEDERTREAVTGTIELLAREVELTLLGAEIDEQKEQPDLVLLTGGGSLVNGLAAALQNALETMVRDLTDIDNTVLLGQLRDQTSAAGQFAIAAGLALRFMNRAGGFNFQTGELRNQNLVVKWRRHLVYGIVASVVVLMSWLGSVAIDIYMQNQRYDQLNKAIETVFRRALPEFKGSIRQAQYASMIKGKINELGESTALFGAEATEAATVDMLREISLAIPDKFNVTISLLSLDRKRVRLSGKADGFNTVDSVKNQLIDSGNFAKVTITGAKATSDGKGVQFNLELIRQPYGGEGS